jgi:hypothetical protein
MPLTWHVGDVIRKLRLEAGFRSQARFGEAVGLNKAQVNRLETNKPVDPRTWHQVTAFFRSTEQELRALVPDQGDQRTRSGPIAQTDELSHDVVRGDDGVTDPLAGALTLALRLWRRFGERVAEDAVTEFVANAKTYDPTLPKTGSKG